MATRLSSPTLIGRHSELGQLQAAVQRAGDGSPGLVLVAGEAGVGKTRLVEELATWARERGNRVLIGGCVSLSAEEAPFAPIVEALRPLIREIAPQDLDSIVGQNTAGLAPLMPDLAPVSSLPGSTGISPDTAQGRLLELLLAMLARLAARSPLLVILEDIHWADRSTLDVLAFLSRNLRTEPLLLVTTFRTDEPGARQQLLPFIGEMERRERSERIDLLRLNRAEVAEQLSAVLGVPAGLGLVDAVYARSQGNAFFAEELLAAESISGALPQTLRDVLSARVGALSRPTQELVRVASAAGRRFSETLLARMAEGDAIIFGGALREALDHQILVRADRAGGELLGFRHAIVQELLYDDLLPSERVRLHAACARAIEEQLTASPDAGLASELAYHWHAAHRPERALPASIAAGMAAEAVGARTEAAIHFERVIEIADESPAALAGQPLDLAQLLERAAANQLENPGRAVEHITRALDLTDAEQDPKRAGLLHAALGRYLWFSGDGGGSLASCQEAMRYVPEEPPSTVRAGVAAGLGQILMILGHHGEAIRYAEEAVRIAAQTDARAIESHALNTLGISTAYLGDVEAGVAMLHRALELAEAVDSADDIGRAYGNLTDVLIFSAARYDQAAEIGEEAVGTDPPRIAGVLAALVHADIVLARYLAGRWDEARAALDRAYLQPAGVTGEIALGIRAAQLEVGSGAFDRAAAQIDLLRRRLEGAADIQWIAPTIAAQAEMAIWTGDSATAFRAVADGMSRMPPLSGANVSRMGPMLALGVRATADLASRTRHQRTRVDLDAHRREGAELLEMIRSMRDQVAVEWPAHVRLIEPHVASAEAEMSRLDGRSDPEAWVTAARQFEQLGQPYDRAYATYREGEALLDLHRQTGRAGTALREAHAMAVKLGALPLRSAIEEVAGRARVDLSQTGVARGGLGRPSGLTEREVEVLRLVARGQTNRQIGKRLFITERTASHHVSNILGKLGVSSRVGAAAEAVRLGLTSRRT